LFAALAAKRLAWLHRCAASVTEHDFPPRRFLSRHVAATCRSTHDIPTRHPQMIRNSRLRVQLKVPCVHSNLPVTASKRRTSSPENEKAARQQGGLFFFKGE
jgi:hypothetical protein